jgi:hypothetical protein
MKITKLLVCAALFSAQSSFSMEFPTGSTPDKQIQQAAIYVGAIFVGAAFAHIKFEVWPKIAERCCKKN